MERTLSILQLATETLHIIYSSLPPQDILSVRKTCRYLYDSTKHRPVWIAALHRTCLANGLFRPSYPMADMSLKALEHASLSPHRFSSRGMMTGPDATPEVIGPVSTRLLNNPAGPTEGFDYLYLVPGGRFAVTSGDLGVKLWDLGNGAGQLINPHPVAEIDNLPPETVILNCCQTSDGNGILVFSALKDLELEEEPSTMRFKCITVHRIYPEQLAPFIEAAILSRPNGDNFEAYLVSCQERMVVLVSRNRITFWDFNRDAIAGGEHTAGMNFKKILIVNIDYIFLLDNCGISVFQRPHLYKRGADGTFPPEDNRALEALTNVAHPCPRPYRHFDASSYSWMGYYNFALLAISHANAPVIDTYSVITPNHPYLPKLMPALTKTFSFNFDNEVLPEGDVQMRSVGEFMTMAWLDAQTSHLAEIIVVIIPKVQQSVVATGRPYTAYQTKYIWQPDRDFFECKDFSFCAASGRLCVLTTNNDILVVDFIAPPT